MSQDLKFSILIPIKFKARSNIMTESTNEAIANVAATQNEPDVDEPTSESQPAPNTITTPSRPVGFLDLPAEVRLMIYRQVLLDTDDSHLPAGFAYLCPSSLSLALLKTCRLIHNEAFHVFYGENQFEECFESEDYHYYLPCFPRIIDTIQNILLTIKFALEDPWYQLARYVRYFGDPSVTRCTLTVEIEPFSHDVRFPKWLIRALGRFTNFSIIELQVHYHHPYDEDHANTPAALEYLKKALEPMLGHAECIIPDSKDMSLYLVNHETTLRFEPIDHWKRWGEPGYEDWAECLDGIRLQWNDDGSSINDSKTWASQSGD